MDCTYKNPNAPIEDRVKDLLSRMTLQEKIGQMTQIERSVATPADLKSFSIGSILSAGGSVPFQKALPADWADMVDKFQQAALESRLGIPLIYGIDAVHGNNSVYGATIFPHNVGLGATRDADLAQRIGAATALEVRATGIHYDFAPCVAVCRDPRWGRCFECYSEDTNIVRKMTSIITGLQGKPPADYPKGYPFVAGRNNVIACAKHFVGDGGTEKAYVTSGECSVQGFVISDWEALDRLTEPRGSNYRYCISTAVNAGIDMVMVPLRYKQFMDDLTFLVESGEVLMSRIDDAVERILRVKFVAGLFEYPFSDRSLLDIVGCKFNSKRPSFRDSVCLLVRRNMFATFYQLHRELAREAVRKSLVLLKNGKNPENPFLPLDRTAKRILVAGSHADNLGYQCGGWTSTWFGGSGRITIGTTILDAIRESAGDKTEVIYDEYPSTNTLAGQYSFAIVVVGEPPYAETLGDNKELVIPFNGSDIISSVADKIPTLAILISGRPLVLEPQVLEKVDAFIAAWLPGTEGRGLTDVVFGDFEFEGRLPMTWFRSNDQLLMNPGQNSYDPLFPLGFGLTYNKEKKPQE
ncbi:hypothetical protein Gotur_028906 [Gossypium turneri]